MKERLLKLLTVKSLVTMILTGVFAYLSVIGTITAQEFMAVFVMIVSFYFGTQAERKATESGEVK